MRRNVLVRTEGTSALEFGLLLPLLMVITLGIIDYGHIFFVNLSMTNAAREGARVGVTRNAAEAQAAAEQAAAFYLERAGVNAAIQATTPTDADPTVVVTITLEPFEPLVGFVPTPTRLSASASMRWELARP